MEKGVRLKFCLLQFNVVYGDVDANIKKVSSFLSAIEPKSVDVVLLPELWVGGYALSILEDMAGNFDRVVNFLCDMAVSKRVAFYGSVVFKDKDGFMFNRGIFISKDGKLSAFYDKIHLFGLMEEDKHFKAGNRLVTVDLNGSKWGLAICYDLRFPLMWYALSKMDVCGVLLVAQWPKLRQIHFKSLLKARAIENFYYVVAVNNVGITGDNEFAGGSSVISPWGDVLCSIEGGEGLLVREINLLEVKKARATIPVFKDRRPDVYGG